MATANIVAHAALSNVIALFPDRCPPAKAAPAGEREAISEMSDRIMQGADANGRRINTGPMFAALALAGMIDKLADLAGRSPNAVEARNHAMNLAATLADGGVYA